MEYEIGDKLRPIGKHFGTVVYVVINKIANKYTGETLYTIEQIGLGKSILENISEDSLNKDFIKI